MIQCKHCGWSGSFQDLENGSLCPCCSKMPTSISSININSLKITKLVDINS